MINRSPFNFVAAVSLMLSFGFNIAFAATLTNDIPLNFAQQEYVDDMIENHVFQLDSENNFYPSQVISKVSFIKASFTAAGIDAPNTLLDTPFKDVPADSWFTPYVKKALEVRAIAPTFDGYFHPGDSLSRQEALSIALAIYGIPIDQQTPTPANLFDDILPNRLFASHFQTAYLLEIKFDKDPELFHPALPLTKVDASELLFKLKSATQYFQTGEPGVFSLPADQPYLLASPDISETQQRLLENPDFAILLDVWDRIHNQYLDGANVNDLKLIQQSIIGMVKGLNDDYSEFQSADSNGENFIYIPDKYEGIGAVIEKINDQFIIQTTLNNSPAYRAGLQTGDIIYQIENTKIETVTSDNITDLIKGPAGTILHLQVKRNGQILSFEITRESIDITSIHYQILPGNINYLRVDQFSEDSAAEFEEILPEIIKSGSTKLIIDLRNNPGGYLSSTQTIMNHFLSKDQVNFYTKDALGTLTPYTSSGPGELYHQKIAVLINEGSASAAEIMAGALQDHGLGQIIGVTSFGKGTVQQITDYQNSGSLKLTIAQWLTPNQTSISHLGIIPNQIITISDAQKAAGQDPQLEAAKNYLQ